MAPDRWLPQGEWVTRARGARLYPALVAVVAVPVTVASFTPVTSRTPAFVLSALTALWLAWAFFWRPRLEVRREEITIVNPWRTHVVPWAALVDVETRFYLTLVTPQGRYAAVAAPAPGGSASLRPKDRDDVAGPRPSDLLSSDSGNAARIVRNHWHSLVEAQVLDHGAPEARPRTRHAVAVIAVAVAGTVLSVVAWLVA